MKHKRLLFILVLLFCSSILFAEALPIPDFAKDIRIITNDNIYLIQHRNPYAEVWETHWNNVYCSLGEAQAYTTMYIWKEERLWNVDNMTNGWYVIDDKK